MRLSPNEIVKCEVTRDTVTLTLANGVSVGISSNTNYLHLSFSGIQEINPDGHLLNATPFAFGGVEGIEPLKLANYVDLEYKPSSRG